MLVLNHESPTATLVNGIPPSLESQRIPPQTYSRRNLPETSAWQSRAEALRESIVVHAENWTLLV